MWLQVASVQLSSPAELQVTMETSLLSTGLDWAESLVPRGSALTSAWRAPAVPWCHHQGTAGAGSIGARALRWSPKDGRCSWTGNRRKEDRLWTPNPSTKLEDLSEVGVVSDPDATLGAQLFPWSVRFCSGPVREGVKIQALSSKRTRATSLIEVLTGLLTASTESAGVCSSSSSELIGWKEMGMSQTGISPDARLEEVYEMLLVILILHPVNGGNDELRDDPALWTRSEAEKEALIPPRPQKGPPKNPHRPMKGLVKIHRSLQVLVRTHRPCWT